MTPLCANASPCASTLSIFWLPLLVVAINNAFAHRRGALSLDYPMRWRIISPSPQTPSQAMTARTPATQAGRVRGVRKHLEPRRIDAKRYAVDWRQSSRHAMRQALGNRGETKASRAGFWFIHHQPENHKLRGEGTACFSWQRNRRFYFGWLT